MSGSGPEQEEVGLQEAERDWAAAKAFYENLVSKKPRPVRAGGMGIGEGVGLEGAWTGLEGGGGRGLGWGGRGLEGYDGAGGVMKGLFFFWEGCQDLGGGCRGWKALEGGGRGMGRGLGAWGGDTGLEGCRDFSGVPALGGVPGLWGGDARI